MTQQWCIKKLKLCVHLDKETIHTPLVNNLRWGTWKLSAFDFSVLSYHFKNFGYYWQI